MKTIALRFGETFAPECGTIAAHKEVIEKYGYVWYGKLGTPISNKVIEEILKEETPRVLLISSGKPYRYWAYVTKIQRDIPPREEIPSYYRDICEKFKTWLQIKEFKEAPKDVMAKCVIASSKRPLSEVSQRSLSPYFIIDTIEDV